MIYLLCFAFSIFFCYLGYKNENKKISNRIFSILAILIPAILAGLRDTSIGTDVEVYLTVAHKLAQNYNDFFEYCSILDLEFLYKAMVFFVTKIFGSINMVMFIQHFIICTLFFIGAKNFKEKANPIITFSLFLLMYYNISLNIMRQFMAMSIVFYAYKFVKEEKFLKYLFYVLLATLFHSSAIISLVIYLLYKICKSKHKYLYSFFVLGILILAIVFYNPTLELLVKTGMINAKFMRYSLDYSVADFNYVDTLIKLYTLFITFFQLKKLKKDKDNFFYTLISVFDIVILQISIFSPQIMRLSMYFGIIALVNVSRIITDSRQNKVPLTLVTYGIYLLYFVMYYIIGGAGETYPYIMMRK